MEIEVLEESKNHIRFVLPEMDHTFSNILVETLNAFSEVDTAAYSIKHPLVGRPEFVVKVKQGNSVRAILKKAAKKIEKDISDAKKSFSKAAA